MNCIALMGRITRDPELGHTPNSVPVTSFSIAVDRGYVKKGEERQTDFIDIVAWRATAEFICRNFIKGQMIAVSGRVQTRNFTDRDGNKRKAVEVVAEQVFFCAGKRERDTPTRSDEDAVQQDEQDNFTQINDSEDLPF